MAKYKVEYDLERDKVTRTLTFMGKEYSEVWTEGNSYCQCGLVALVDNEFCDLPEYVAGAVGNITYAADDEVMEYLETLTDYEKGKR